jgi:thermolysin
MAAAAADSDGFRGANNLKTSANVDIYRANAKDVPVYVQGRLATGADGAWVETALQYFDQYKAAYRMDSPVEQLSVRMLERDDLGMRHIRFDQMHNGLRVIGGELVAHFSADNVLRTVNGTFVADIQMGVLPNVPESDALRIADSDLQSFFGKGEPNAPELVVFPWEGVNYLAWRLFLRSDTPMGRWEYIVDANTGEVIFKANRIMNEAAANDIGTGTGVMGTSRNHIDTDFDGSTYRMIDYTRRANNNAHGHDGQMAAGADIRTNVAGSSLPGTLATDADNVWTDPNTQSPAVDGQVYTGLVYDYMLSHLGRNGYDNQGSSMLTVVNYSGEGDDNAYWDGLRIVVWSWSSGWRSLAGCPDVIAHEWGHAITERASNLVYEKEPGALNESFSDMIGAAFEWAHDTMDVPDWAMGENGRLTGVGFRDMEDPHAFGDPDFYGTSDPNWIDVEGCSPSQFNDYCGVHTNSGVGNKWFQLLSDGGVHYGQNVVGIGPENAILVAYRANLFYWNSQTDYHEAALGTISAAQDLDPSGAWAQSTARAWSAVGVGVPGPGLAITSTNVPDALTPDNPTSFDVEITGTLDGVLLAGSATLWYSIDGGAYQSSALTGSGSSFTATLPGAACDQQVRFFISAEEETNGLYFDPPDTSAAYAALVATNVTTVFSDNFQTNLGWTVSGSATAGQWGRGVPVGGGDRGDPPNDYDGSGQCYLTSNVDGDSDVDGGTTTLVSPTFDLSAGNARIQYARWYSNNFGADPFNDVFNIYISNDNGTNWSLVESVGPVAEASGGWVQHSFYAADFVTPTGTMQMRFDASDLNSGSVVEAGIDAFTVTQYECDAAVPTIATSSLPDWTEGAAYSQQLTAVGGAGGYSWVDLNGDLVGTGLSLSVSGLLSGTPLGSGVISFTAQVTDANSQTDDKVLAVTVNAAVLIETDAALPEWTIGRPYSQQLTYSGGTDPVDWSDKNNDLVGSGLFISASGLLQGTPVSSGPLSFTALVTDAAGSKDERVFSMTVNEAVQITTSTLPDGRDGDSYSEQLDAINGTGSKTWTDKNGDLAGTGLSLSSAGLVTGTPNAEGLISFTARAVDVAGSAAEAVLTITIHPPYICGDINNNGQGPNLTDVTYMVNALFLGGTAIPIPDAANFSGDTTLSLTDLTMLVNFLFNGGAGLTCSPVI